MNIQAALAHGTDTLTGCSYSPRVDAKRLLSHILRREPAYFVAFGDQVLGQAEENQYRQWLARRKHGEPIAYLTGRQGFWSLDLVVGPSVLIPRPETEVLVEAALRMMPAARARVLDLGTGSGAVALALAKERPQWEVVATDFSEAALEIARANRDRLGLKRVKILQGSWYEPFSEEARFDLVISNPPYVAEGDPHLARGDLRFEPRSALVSGADGLDDLRRIVRGAPARLRCAGALLMEHGFDQSEAVIGLFRRAGFSDVQALKDDAGHFRAVFGVVIQNVFSVTK